MKLKHYWFSITEEYLKANNIKVLDVLQSYRSIKKWACILHDKDNYTKYDELENPEHKEGTHKPNHVHVYVNFGDNSIDHKMVASWFNINDHSIKKIITSASNCLLYFVHGTSDAIAEGKFQYDWSEVKHSPNWNPEVFTEEERFNLGIGNFKEYSYKEQIERVHQIKDVTLRIKMQKKLDDAFTTELKYRATFIDRFIQVMFVTGESGTGKTTFARQFVEKLNYFDIVPKEYWRKTSKSDDKEKMFRHLDYGISGSSNDAFENYKGEDVYILDDMRDDSFSFTDLLKFLDNHTNSPVKSRYQNKCFFGVLLVITSKQKLSEWYKGDDKDKLDSATLKQLYRRISNYVIVKEDYIYLYNELNNNGEPCGNCSVIANNTLDYYKDKPKAINVSNLITDVFGKVEPKTLKVGQITLTEVLDDGELPF